MSFVPRCSKVQDGFCGNFFKGLNMPTQNVSVFGKSTQPWSTALWGQVFVAVFVARPGPNPFGMHRPVQKMYDMEVDGHDGPLTA